MERLAAFFMILLFILYSANTALTWENPEREARELACASGDIEACPEYNSKPSFLGSLLVYSILVAFSFWWGGYIAAEQKIYHLLVPIFFGFFFEGYLLTGVDFNVVQGIVGAAIMGISAIVGYILFLKKGKCGADH